MEFGTSFQIADIYYVTTLYVNYTLIFKSLYIYIRTVAPEAIGLVPAVYGAEQKWPCPI